jgi:hypothetical protein
MANIQRLPDHAALSRANYKWLVGHTNRTTKVHIQTVQVAKMFLHFYRNNLGGVPIVYW